MRNAPWLVLVAAVVAPGCDRIRATEDLAGPVVAQGLYLGLELPDGMTVDGGDLLSYTAACTVFLAYLSDPNAIEDSPLEGAGVEFRSAANAPLDLADEGDGRYLVTAAEGLVYSPDDTALLNFDVDGGTARMSVEAPDAPSVDVASYMTPRQSFTVDISGQGYDNIIVAVYDIQKSKLTWDNLPTTLGETYAYTHLDEPAEVITVPGDALPGEGSFLVGVAGMRLADTEGFDGINESLSAFMAGQFALRYVITRAE